MNSERRDYKIYMYISKINGKVYVGQTCQKTISRRAKYKGEGYKGSPHFYYAIQKYGWENFEGKVIEEGLSAQEAAEREIFWINKYDSTNPKKGYNIQDKIYGITTWESRQKLRKQGRKNMKGKKIPEEVLKKMREHRPDRHGKNNPMYGKKLSEEKRKQISESLRNRPVSKETREKLRKANLGEKNPMYGKHMSLENKRKRGRKVINLDTGEIFHTTIEAAEFYNLPYKKAIQECCRGKQRKAAGFRWKYLDELDNHTEI